MTMCSVAAAARPKPPMGWSGVAGDVRWGRIAPPRQIFWCWARFVLCCRDEIISPNVAPPPWASKKTPRGSLVAWQVQSVRG